jgi:hypothetical protein
MINRSKRILLLWAVLLASLTTSALVVYNHFFGIGLLQAKATPLPGTVVSPEQTVTYIQLDGPITKNKAELSGLAWYGDYLILLPQFPDRFGEGDGTIFALQKEDILAYLDGISSKPLIPLEIRLVSDGVEETIAGFEGFEAISFVGEQVYLTVEARPDGDMSGHLVSGEILTDLSELRLSADSITEIPLTIQSDNKSYEALSIAGDRLFTLFEVNGKHINPEPQAQCFTLELISCQPINFPRLEYRLTDSTDLDQQGRFWVLNYHFPLDTNLKPESDPLTIQYGLGSSHAAYKTIERLVEYHYNINNNTITRTNRPPLQFQLTGIPHNWEGVVRLDSLGFLLVTDKFPCTLLGFVELPGSSE